MKRLVLLGVMCLGFVSAASAQKFAGLAETPPMGWNTWNTFKTDINEELIRGVADAIVESGMRDAGYTYIVLDDGWSAMERDAEGRLVAHPQKFPSGMKALGDYIHSKGLKFGLYNCAGDKTCAGYPGGNGHEEVDGRTYASWGVDYLKYDWCHTKGADAKVRYTKMRDGLYAAGRPVVFSMCEWGVSEPWTWAEDVGHLWRTGDDIQNCWDCRRPHSGVKVILDRQVGLAPYAGPDHWNDPDILEVGNPGLTLAEWRAHFSLWCMLAAPLMAGNDVRSMTPEVRAMLIDTDVIAIDQDPLGKQGDRIAKADGYEVWARDLAGGDQAVCILNTGKEPAAIKFQWGDLTSVLPSAKIRDLWEKKDAGTTSEPFDRTIEPHGVVLLRLTPVSARP